MRRLLLAVAVGAVVLGAAGCSTDKSPTPATTTSPPVAGFTPPPGASAPAGAAKPGGVGSNGDAALAGNTKAICNQAAKTGGQFGSMFAQDRKLLVDADSSKDKDLSGKVKQKATRDVENYSFALNDMSKLAADPVLKQALSDMGKQVTAVKGDVRKIDDKKLGTLRVTLNQACGK